MHQNFVISRLCDIFAHMVFGNTTLFYQHEMALVELQFEHCPSITDCGFSKSLRHNSFFDLVISGGAQQSLSSHFDTSLEKS